MVFGLDPQGLEDFARYQRHDDDHDGHAALASRAFLWEDWRRVAGSPPRVRCRGLGGRSWDQASQSVHPTTPPFANDTVHSPKG